MNNTDFKVENLRVKDLPPLEPGPAKPRHRGREFVMVSHKQFNQLGKARHFAAERVFLHLLFLTWRAPEKPVVLANEELTRKGVDRHIKRRALIELEALGLVRVEWRYKKSPIVTVLGG